MYVFKTPLFAWSAPGLLVCSVAICLLEEHRKQEDGEKKARLTYLNTASYWGSNKQQGEKQVRSLESCCDDAEMRDACESFWTPSLKWIMINFTVHILCDSAASYKKTHSKAYCLQPFCNKEWKDNATNADVLSQSPAKNSTLSLDTSCQNWNGGTWTEFMNRSKPSNNRFSPKSTGAKGLSWTAGQINMNTEHEYRDGFEIIFPYSVTLWFCW